MSIHKQTNKHFQILNISAKSSRISTKFSGELSVGVPKRLKQKKSINKQINILEPIYLSQIKSDIHEILRVSDGDPSATKWGPENPHLVAEGHQPSAGARSLAPVGGQTFQYRKKNNQNNTIIVLHYIESFCSTNILQLSINFIICG